MIMCNALTLYVAYEASVSKLAFRMLDGGPPAQKEVPRVMVGSFIVYGEKTLRTSLCIVRIALRYVSGISHRAPFECEHTSAKSCPRRL